MEQVNWILNELSNVMLYHLFRIQVGEEQIHYATHFNVILNYIILILHQPKERWILFKQKVDIPQFPHAQNLLQGLSLQLNLWKCRRSFGQ